jgi:hypothetical protein
VLVQSAMTVTKGSSPLIGTCVLERLCESKLNADHLFNMLWSNSFDFLLDLHTYPGQIESAGPGSLLATYYQFQKAPDCTPGERL